MLLSFLMNRQVLLTIETFRANLTGKEVLACVELQVNVVVALVEELLVARLAGENVLGQVLGPVLCHRVVAFELLLADGTRKSLIGILVLLNVSIKSILLEAGKVASRVGTFKRLSHSMLLGHVRYLCRSMEKDGVAFVARPHLICMECACVLTQAALILEDFAAYCASGLRLRVNVFKRC